MINWTFFVAFLAAASAAPQTFQTVSAPRSQTIRYQQLPVQTFSSGGVQTYSSTPVQTYSSTPVQTYSSAPVQTYSSSSFPVQTFSSNAFPTQYQQYQHFPVQSVQSFPVQQYQFPSVQHVNTLPVQTVHQSQQFSNVPVSDIRFDAKPVNQRVTQFRTQSTALPIIHSTPTPTVSISSTPVSVSPIQVRTEQVHHLPVTQVHHVQPAVTQVHHVQPAVTQFHHVQPTVHHVQPAVHRIIQTNVPVQHNIQTARNEGGYAILRHVQDVQADGTYEFQYETENGIKAEEHGELKNVGSENEANSVTGSYSYVDPEGKTISVSYIADENGFRAQGDHIPKVPEPILRSLEYLRSLPQQQEDNN